MHNNHIAFLDQQKGLRKNIWVPTTFKTSSNQTGLLGMDWCEIYTLSSENDKHFDGMAYNYCGFDRVAMKGSSELLNASSNKAGGGGNDDEDAEEKRTSISQGRQKITLTYFGSIALLYAVL